MKGGWGPGFAASFDAKVKTMNFAKNGRSSKSFRSETVDPVLAGKARPGCYRFGIMIVPARDLTGKPIRRPHSAPT